MRRTVLVVLAVLLSTAIAQQMWERTYGGAGNDYGRSVQQTTDSGYIVAGSTHSFGNGEQVYLIKTNASGDTLWTHNWGGGVPRRNSDGGNSVQQTGDSGYVIAGTTNSFGNWLQVYLIKTNAAGDTLWTGTYGGEGNEYGLSAEQTQDEGFIVVGHTNSYGNGDYDVYLIKVNSSGDTIWTHTYGGTMYDYGSSVQQTLDGGYVVAGYTGSFGRSAQVYLVRASTSGDTIWTRAYGAGSEVGESVQPTQDTGYIVAGFTWSFGDGAQVYLIKTNAAGDTTWTRALGGAGNDFGRSVQQTSDGGYIVAGSTHSFGNGEQVYLIKTDPSGDTLWTRTYGGAGNDGGYSVQQTPDGGYVVAGYATSFGDSTQVYLIKTDPEGVVAVAEPPKSELRKPGRGVTVLSGAASIERLAACDIFDAMGRRTANPKPGVYFIREGLGTRGEGLSRTQKVVVTR